MEYPIITKMFDGEKPRSIFEVGCAAGGLFKSYVDDTGVVVGGIDVDIGGVRSLYPDYADNFIVWNLNKIPWPVADNSYDIVFTVGTILLFPNPFPIIQEMLRVCKDKIILAEVQSEEFDEYGRSVDVTHQEKAIMTADLEQKDNFYSVRITRDYRKVFDKLEKEYQMISGVDNKTIFKCKK